MLLYKSRLIHISFIPPGSAIVAIRLYLKTWIEYLYKVMLWLATITNDSVNMIEPDLRMDPDEFRRGHGQKNTEKCKFALI